MELQYKPINTNKESEDNKVKEKFRIFGKEFVQNNINKCKIIYKNREDDLCEYINDIDDDYNNKDIIAIKLKGYNNKTNMSYMFGDYNKLSSLPNILKWNTSNVNYKVDMFHGCKQELNIPSQFKN